MTSKLTFNKILTFFAILGVLGLVTIVLITRRPYPIVQPIAPPAVSIYEKFIAGSGIIEANTNNIQLSTIIGGVVDKLHVAVGDVVKAGTPLFTLDLRQINAEIAIRQSQVDQASANVKQAMATLQSSKDKFDLAEHLKDKKAISQDDYLNRKNTYLIDQAALKSAQETLQVTQSQLEQSKVIRGIQTICAPMDCEVLQVNVRPGEYAATGVLSSSGNPPTPLMLLGNTHSLHVRVNIDENDAWRFRKGAKAIAYLRGNGDIRLDLTFVRLEPFVIPKTSLTGASTERVDTRVLQPIYAFDPKDLAVYVGQQVDVFIEVPSDLPQENKPEPTIPEKSS